MTGLNVQAPWAELLINGYKSVETRSYPLPKKYEGVPFALIETPGKKRNFKSRIIGTITFSHCFRYPDENSWKDDYNRHLVDIDSQYNWNNKPKYGWVVSDVIKFEKSIRPPTKRGIIFSNGCKV